MSPNDYWISGVKCEARRDNDGGGVCEGRRGGTGLSQGMVVETEAGPEQWGVWKVVLMHGLPVSVAAWLSPAV